MTDPSRWQVHVEAARNLQRVRRLQRTLRDLAVLAALILGYILIGLIWI